MSQISEDRALRAALDRVDPKPPAMANDGGDNRAKKKNWAQSFSNALAMTIADHVRPFFPRARVTPRSDGTGQEFTVGGKVDRKRTDVGVWDDAAGLVLGVSIKTYSFRDYHGGKNGEPARLGRYVRNVKRNDMELRDEADTLHRRQPYATLAALFFLPEDACWDGGGGHSSFAHVVFTLRKRTGRAHPESRPDLFEYVFIGLHRDNGAVRFFDVRQAPRKNQPPLPEETLTMSGLVRMLDSAVTLRNTGVNPDERYAPDDPAWAPPIDMVSLDLAAESPLDLDDVLEDSATVDAEDPRDG